MRRRVEHVGDGTTGLAAVLVAGTLPLGGDAALPAGGYPTVTPLRSVSKDVGVTFEPA